MRRLLLLLPLLIACRWPAPRWTVADPGDAAVLERGAYLGTHVAICATCHSHRDWRHYGGPIDEATLGAGGDSYVELFVLPPGVVMHGSNISPHALAGWTDGEVARAIHGGLSRDGTPLFLSMPFNMYRHLSQPDLDAVIAWIRALPEQPRDVPPSDYKWRLLKDVVATFPAPAVAPTTTPESGTVAYGEYLARLASCRWCHSPIDALGWPLPGRMWSGGQCFPVYEPGGGTVCAPNITPHETGLGAWSREAFIGRFRAMTPQTVRNTAVQPGGFNSPMAWSAYSGMTEEDLGALYDYLMTLPPKKNVVTRWIPPKAELEVEPAAAPAEVEPGAEPAAAPAEAEREAQPAAP